MHFCPYHSIESIKLIIFSSIYHLQTDLLNMFSVLSMSFESSIYSLFAIDYCLISLNKFMAITFLIETIFY